MNRFKWLLFVCVPLVLQGELSWSSGQRAGSFSIQLEVPQEQILSGDFLLLKGTVHFPAAYRFDGEAFVQNLTWSINPLSPPFRIESRYFSDPIVLPGTLLEQQFSIVLEPSLIGEGHPLILSGLNASFIPLNQEEKPIEILTPVFSISILPGNAEELQIAPLLPLGPQFPLELSLLNQERLYAFPEQLKQQQYNQFILDKHSFPWILVFSCSLLYVFYCLSGAAWAYIQSKIDRYRQFYRPEKIALRKLEKLAVRSPKSAKVFYESLKQTLLSYLEERYGKTLQSQTSQEMAVFFTTDQGIPEEMREVTLALFFEADQVLFAEERPVQEKMEAILRKISEQLLIKLK